MTDAQREELESQSETPESVEYAATALDRTVFNKDSNRFIWRTLMDEGIREGTGSRVGKTIVFARNHRHAVHLAELFTEMYPQYGSTFCRVIDNQEPKAEQLIDDFKDKANELTIAISVDMLDTGIDVPAIVNLVFAKPVKSYVKFWQMIGRGTRTSGSSTRSSRRPSRPSSARSCSSSSRLVSTSLRPRSTGWRRPCSRRPSTSS
jgi:type I restriction enzyme R subunit